MPTVELSGVAIVAVGSFNPAIFQPRWLVETKLLPDNEAATALEKMVVTHELTAYDAGWLGLQVTVQKAVFSTVQEAREPDLRDLVSGVLELLPHTPITALGLNADVHFKVESVEAWHKIGDLFMPKERWEPLFAGDDWKPRAGGLKSGLRTMSVEAWRPNGQDYVRVQVAPSVRIENGVYIGINSHFQMGQADKPSNGYAAAKIIGERWDETRALEREMLQRIVGWAN